MRVAAILFSYAVAFAAIYAAFHTAPEMTWPNSPTEHRAACLLIIGLVAKCIGHYLMLTPSRSRG